MRKQELIDIVGADNVFDDERTLEEYSEDYSFVTPKRPFCVVRPTNRKQVQEIVKSANKDGTALTPVSSGPPRFRGDTIPKLGGVILDLSGMNKILKISRRNRYVVIEAGVTFDRLRSELDKEDLDLLPTLLPRSTKSVLAAFLEREPILVPKRHWHAVDPMMCGEIIFGTGDIMRTGSAASLTDEDVEKGEIWAGSPFSPAFFEAMRMVQGAQGTLGIVTWASFYCRLKPSINRPWFIPSQNIEALIQFARELLRLRLGEELFILNSFDLANIISKSSGEIRELGRVLPPWILFLNLIGKKRHPEEEIEYQQELVLDFARRFGLGLQPAVEGISARDLLKNLESPPKEYWKLRFKGCCQDLSFLTLSDKIPSMVRLMQEVASEHEYPTAELGVYIQPVVQGTSYHCEFTLMYDPQNVDEKASIERLYLDAARRLYNAGAFYNRPYGALADIVYTRHAPTVWTLRKVKSIFDPNNILNPGNLCF